MKICTSCGESKSLECFQIRSASKDGRTARCRDCLRAYDRVRNATPERRAAQKSYVQGKGRQAAIATKLKWQASNPKKRRVHNLVAAAIKKGALVKGPCEVCGNPKVVAHHDDYDKPLEIRWLCSVDHRAWHCEHGEALNPD